MSSGRRDGFCNDTNKGSTESPIPALILRLETNYKKASRRNECVGGGWGRGAYAIKEKMKSSMLLMRQEWRSFTLGLFSFSFSCLFFF